jgi:ABC-2 type transport system ATP-binding protein
LILDEPTVGLDPRQVAEIRAVIKELAGQHTIILSTHILPEVQASCERIIIINQGHIVAQDTIAGISTRTMNSTKVHLRVLRPSDDLLSSLRHVPGVRNAQRSVAGHYEIETDSSESIPQDIAGLVIQKNSGLLEIRSETSNLEDVFLKLTSSEETQGAQA